MVGFSLNFHGKIPQDVLLQRQDAEIRLLELMKRCFSLKVKCDKEYSYALCNLAAKSSENLENCGEIWTGSSLFKFWKNWSGSMEIIGKTLRENADSMEINLVEVLGNLSAEKRKIKKSFQEEHSRIQQQLNNITEEVSKKKMEYQKCLEIYKLTRTKFEEYYVKNGKSGRKLDEVREKYQKACRKLHLTHNEYVLLLCEAVEFEKDFRNVLLPGLLERQQIIQENFVDIWKQVLLDATVAPCENTAKLINPNEEYKEFIERFKSTQQGVETSKIFTFDETLTDESLKFAPNQLAVDNLTIEWLKKKLNELEARIKETEDKRHALISSSSATSNANGRNSLNSISNSDINSRISNLIELDHSKREIEELECTERKNKKQSELIKSALNELGCEEAPSGCDLTTTPTVAPPNENMPKKNTNSISSIEKLQVVPKTTEIAMVAGVGKFAKILRKPFRRKSISPVAPPRNGKNRRGSDDSGDAAQIPSKTVENLSSGSDEKSLGSEDWFHGVLPREEVVRLLVQDGDFLVRETTRNDESQTVLSVCWGGHKHFIVQTTIEGQFRFEGPSFPSIRDLILYQLSSGLPVTGRSGAILLKPIPRERWELNNDDVVLIEKIGRGNFGDVYRAHLKDNASEILAVKTCRGTLPEEHKKKFLQEGRILKQYEHPNIVKLVGICVRKQPIMIVMELVPGGSLLTFLRKNQGDVAVLSVGDLTKMCVDVAAGMQYLESKNCIHRDLAARNCLIGYENVVKISDFGMSREEEEYVVSDGMKQIPIKWTAPEALNFGKYTSACDVWSYGILCWEIFSHGDTPYTGMSNSKAREMIDSGYRMPSPGNGRATPEEIYKLMLQCWEYEPEKRPNFEHIYTVVETIHNNLIRPR